MGSACFGSRGLSIGEARRVLRITGALLSKSRPLPSWAALMAATTVAASRGSGRPTPLGEIVGDVDGIGGQGLDTGALAPGEPLPQLSAVGSLGVLAHRELDEFAGVSSKVRPSSP